MNWGMTRPIWAKKTKPLKEYRPRPMPASRPDPMDKLDAAAADLDRQRFLGYDKPELTDFIRSQGEDTFPCPGAELGERDSDTDKAKAMRRYRDRLRKRAEREGQAKNPRGSYKP